MSEIERQSALRLVILLGFISLFADVTYEAARSINGPYLAALGASAAAVGIIAGLGELIGYGLRIITGLISDRTRRYWAITIFGYTVNLLAVPALALAGRWEIAAILMITERLGKAIRTPARDAMLSHASHDVGRGRAFGLHEAMDQVGAMLGPIIVAVVLAVKGSYQYGFGILAIPAALALTVLVIARRTYPHPHDLEPAIAGQSTKFQTTYWIYLAGVACIALGFADFSLISFHAKITGIVPDTWIPLIYAGAMGVDALSALVLGRLYDRGGLKAVMMMIAASAWFAPFVFLGGRTMLIAGMILWGMGMGALESTIRAVVADLVHRDRRGTGYGVFNAGFGISWFVGSTLMGILYERSLVAVAVFSIAFQLLALPFLNAVQKRIGN
ncbi:MAG: MFS transporter [Candidatus Zixiibacteriota bacterium]|nr:MAG: MFS transporter [candidate division Zixibacteria bacterium]